MRFKKGKKSNAFMLNADERAILQDLTNVLHICIHKSDILKDCIKLTNADYKVLIELRDILRFFE